MLETASVQLMMYINSQGMDQVDLPSLLPLPPSSEPPVASGTPTASSLSTAAGWPVDMFIQSKLAMYIAYSNMNTHKLDLGICPDVTQSHCMQLLWR